VAAAAGAAATGAAASKAAKDAAKKMAGTATNTIRGRPAPKPATFSAQGLTQKFSWNVFRYFGDFIHLIGVLILLITIKKNQSVTGLSLRTAMMYAVLFTCRYLDLFTHRQPLYLIFFKISYLITAWIIVYYFGKYFHTFERSKDTVNIAVIFGACFLAAWMTNGGTGLVQTFWIYSQYLEAFALVPQYVFCYRDPTNRDKGRVLFIMCIGIYRCCYAANWIYKKVNVSYYSDVHSWLGGIFEILFFFDYLMHHCGGVSILKTIVLGVDNTMRSVSDGIEYRVLGTSSALRTFLFLRTQKLKQSISDYISQCFVSKIISLNGKIWSVVNIKQVMKSTKHSGRGMFCRQQTRMPASSTSRWSWPCRTNFLTFVGPNLLCIQVIDNMSISIKKTNQESTTQF
jgi:ER lumen protein retaining receptor